MINHERAIENFIARYAFLVDDGDFEGLGALMAEAEFTLNDNRLAIGSAAVTALAEKTLRTHDDGTPRKRHVTTNIIMEVSDDDDSATSRSYYTVFQATEDFQPIACGRYEDLFAQQDGRWVFKRRQVRTGLAGNSAITCGKEENGQRADCCWSS